MINRFDFETYFGNKAVAKRSTIGEYVKHRDHVQIVQDMNSITEHYMGTIKSLNKEITDMIATGLKDHYDSQEKIHDLESQLEHSNNTVHNLLDTIEDKDEIIELLGQETWLDKLVKDWTW